MKKFICLNLLLICCFCSVFGQSETSSYSCKSLPMRSAAATSRISQSKKVALPIVLVSALEREIDVQSLTDGTVSSVFSFKNDSNGFYSVVMVKFAMDSFITYSNLIDVTVKTGDVLKPGQAIAKARTRKDIGKSEIEISIFCENKGIGNNPKALDESSVIAFIKKADY